MSKKMIQGANFNNPSKQRFSGGVYEKCLRLVMIVVFVAVIVGGDHIYKQIDTPLSRIVVGGEFKHLQKEELANLVNGQIDGGFLSTNLNQLREQLQGHPWVHEVSIRREWPSTLKVEVVEEVPIARLGKQGFLNRLGDQLEISDNSNLQTLPVLRAEFGSTQDMIQQYQLLAELLLPISLKLTELQRDSVGAWQASTAPGIRLVLGRDEIAEKIRRLVIVWQSGLSLQSDSIETIDLRYPNGLAVSWKESALTDSDDQILLKNVSSSA
jgi:cell division protein FtsQ